MSIIHDALKKVETSRQTKPPARPAGRTPSVNTQKLIPKRRKFPYALAGLVALILAVSVALMLARSSRGTVQAFETPREINRLTLNGVFFSGSMGYAIMNNEVVQAGDTCRGVRIKEIKKDAVVVQDRGIEYTLKTGN